MQRAIHSRTFRLIYRSPKQRDNFSSIKICINFIYFAIWIGTFKNLVGSFTNMLTLTTSLRSVTRINSNQFYTTKQRFISQERTKLRKIPFAKFCSKSFISIFRSKTNISQIFNRNSFSLFFCRCYNRFCNSMIHYSCRSFLYPTKPFQKSFTRLRAFGLNGTTNPLFLFSIFIKPFGRMFFIIRCYCNISKSKINTNKFFNIFYFFIRNFNSLKQIKLSFFKNQISFSFYIRKVIFIMTNKWYSFSSTINSPQRNSHFINLISKYSTVISYTSKQFIFTLNFFINFITVSNFTNAPHSHLSRDIKSIFNHIIRFFMYFKLIKNLFIKSNFRNIITSCIGFNQSIFQRLKLNIVRQQFYFQSQFHVTNIFLIFEESKLIIIKFKEGISQNSSHSLKPYVFPCAN